MCKGLLLDDPASHFFRIRGVLSTDQVVYVHPKALSLDGTCCSPPACNWGLDAQMQAGVRAAALTISNANYQVCQEVLACSHPDSLGHNPCFCRDYLTFLEPLMEWVLDRVAPKGSTIWCVFFLWRDWGPPFQQNSHVFSLGFPFSPTRGTNSKNSEPPICRLFFWGSIQPVTTSPTHQLLAS